MIPAWAGPRVFWRPWCFGGGWGSHKMKLALGSLQTAQDSVSSRPSGPSPQGGGAENGASRGGAEGLGGWCHHNAHCTEEETQAQRELACPAESQTGRAVVTPRGCLCQPKTVAFGQFLPAFVQVRLESCSDEPQSQWIVGAVTGEPGTLSPPASPAHP